MYPLLRLTAKDQSFSQRKTEFGVRYQLQVLMRCGYTDRNLHVSVNIFHIHKNLTILTQDLVTPLNERSFIC
ncbi:hypothetical protein DU508_23425 [Pedobacter chinensis]|uniref:Uncharacterized protein n=1 Tax=Pedobacter chinensis TaxID=2282421 RepID=A0A369PTZ9_9SPHI|nr:hypothetical protein DU508_23425 [Pedobacter chinensis]